MQEQELINISVESNIKIMAETIFEQFGTTKSEAIELFYCQVALTKDISFLQKSLNTETIEAIEMVENNEGLTSYSSFAQLRQELEV